METTNRIDALLKKVNGGEIRIVGSHLPKLGAHIEHRLHCVWCKGTGAIDPSKPGLGRNTCPPCDGEGLRALSDEPCQCADCVQLEEVLQPGVEQEPRFLTRADCGALGCDGTCKGEPWGHEKTAAELEAQLYAEIPELEPSRLRNARRAERRQQLRKAAGK